MTTSERHCSTGPIRGCMSERNVDGPEVQIRKGRPGSLSRFFLLAELSPNHGQLGAILNPDKCEIYPALKQV